MRYLLSVYRHLHRGRSRLSGATFLYSHHFRSLAQSGRMVWTQNVRKNRIWGREESRIMSVLCGLEFAVWCLVSGVRSLEAWGPGSRGPQKIPHKSGRHVEVCVEKQIIGLFPGLHQKNPCPASKRASAVGISSSAPHGQLLYY